MHCHQVLALLAISFAGTMLSAQDSEPAQSADSLTTVEVEWLNRLAPLVRDQFRPDQLILRWDEWGHSDLVMSTYNPFVPADLKIGAVMMDGSLGFPVFSTLITSSVKPDIPGPEPVLADGSRGSFDAPAGIIYRIVPMGDETRRNQSYFHWDKGYYQYNNVQVGAVSELGGGGNLLAAAEGRNHAGMYGLAGPSTTGSDGNVLQNYMLDYRHQPSAGIHINYTMLNQVERVGLPFQTGGTYDAEQRDGNLWAHGLSLLADRESWQFTASAASATNTLKVSPRLDESGLSRRSISAWYTTGLTYRLTGSLLFRAIINGKTRQIDDHQLGYTEAHSLDGDLQVFWESGKISAQGGLTLAGSGVRPGGLFEFRTGLGTLTLAARATSFLDMPYTERRPMQENQENTGWLTEPVVLQNTYLAYEYYSPKFSGSARLGLQATNDDRKAQSWSGSMIWQPWIKALRISGQVSGLTTESRSFPPRITAHGALTVTAPLKRARAKPFFTISTMFSKTDFSHIWDPRYGDLLALPYPMNEGGEIGMAMWANLCLGVKVANFELRYQIYNLTSSTIEVAPPNIFGATYLPGSPLVHYALTWCFHPTKAAVAG